MNSIISYFSFKTNGIVTRESYSTILPNEMIQKIFDFLPIQAFYSSTISSVSFQFYLMSKPLLREKINKELTQVYKQITKIVKNSFHTVSRPLWFNHDSTKEQRYFVDITYQYDQHNFPAIKCHIEHEIFNFDSTENEIDEKKLNDHRFYLIDSIERTKDWGWTTTESTKIKLIANAHLKNELQTLTERVLQKINEFRHYSCKIGTD